MEYTRHDPLTTPLYHIINSSFESFLEKNEHELPGYVVKEIKDYIRCGDIAYGFARLKCKDCCDEKTIPFSCKRRGFCPSCCARRMSQTTENLIEQVLPSVPYRQWVLSFPFALRFWLAKSNKILAYIHKIFISTISVFYESEVQEAFGVTSAKAGSITFIQKCGSALNSNTHFHAVFVEDAFEKKDGSVVFHQAARPTDQDVATVLQIITERIIKFLQKKGLLKDEVKSLEEFDTHTKIHLGSTHSFIATGENAGTSVRKIGEGFGDYGEMPVIQKEKCASLNNFTLHAATFVKEQQRKQLKKLLSHCLRPPISNERIELVDFGDVRYNLKNKFYDGTTAVQFTREEFIEKIIGIIPIPWVNLIRYNGVFAPASPLRKVITMGLAVVPKKHPKKPVRIEWAELLKRTFNIDATVCEKCGGKYILDALIKLGGPLHSPQNRAPPTRTFQEFTYHPT